ncbi:MAG: endo-1,4-beta-xylanase [Opitutae bacterium]|nr:endo-1,4-beta-xylanase [Opitutae bacterium]
MATALSTYEMLWDDPEVAACIDTGIERHRKAGATLRVEDAAGRPLPGAQVLVEQTHSDFLFGANLFMLGGYPTPELNARYEEAFTGLFNAATVSLYWKGMEPERGKVRFAADSPPVYRRPPVDASVGFCEKHGLNMNGHNLVWDSAKWSVPDWVPDDPAQSAPLWEERIRQIAARYGTRIQRWDVVNEVLIGGVAPRSRPMPANYERLSFRWAEKHLPASAFLMINDDSKTWTVNRRPYIDLIRRLRADGARIDGAGMQFHLFKDEELLRVLAGEAYRPRDLLAALDEVGTTGLPLHISEITITAPLAFATGEATQARVAHNLYRLWFSHPAVQAITWWNVPDGGAAPGEDRVASGLLNRNLEPKPAYNALHDLIRREWRTRLTGTTGADAGFAFRGFHGRYRAQVMHRGATHSAEFALRPGGPNAVTVRLSAAS